MKTFKCAGFVAGLLVSGGLYVPAMAVDGSQLPSGEGLCTTGCTVAGAEVDDDATIEARAKTGTGPDMGILSDRRVILDVAEVGTLANGIKVYSFKYLWDDKVRIGVIAQDLNERPDTKTAVLALANGLLGVDYEALGMRMATEAQWKEAGLAALKVDFKPERTRSARLDEPVRLFNKRPGM